MWKNIENLLKEIKELEKKQNEIKGKIGLTIGLITLEKVYHAECYKNIENRRKNKIKFFKHASEDICRHAKHYELNAIAYHGNCLIARPGSKYSKLRESLLLINGGFRIEYKGNLLIAHSNQMFDRITDINGHTINLPKKGKGLMQATPMVDLLDEATDRDNGYWIGWDMLIIPKNTDHYQEEIITEEEIWEELEELEEL